VVLGVGRLLLHQDDLLHQGELLLLHHLVCHLVPGVEDLQLLVQEAVQHLQVVPLPPKLLPTVLKDSCDGRGWQRVGGEPGEDLPHAVHGQLRALLLPVPAPPPPLQVPHLALLLLPFPPRQGVWAAARPGRRQEAGGQGEGVRWGPGLDQELLEEGRGNGDRGGKWGIERFGGWQGDIDVKRILDEARWRGAP